MTILELAEFLCAKLPWPLRSSKDRDESVELRGMPIKVCDGVKVCPCERIFVFTIVHVL